jgi:hypothetical protein
MMDTPLPLSVARKEPQHVIRGLLSHLGIIRVGRGLPVHEGVIRICVAEKGQRGGGGGVRRVIALLTNRDGWEPELELEPCTSRPTKAISAPRP